MQPPSEALVALESLGLRLDGAEIETLSRFVGLVRERNRSLNLVSAGDAEKLWGRHVADSSCRGALPDRSVCQASWHASRRHPHTGGWQIPDGRDRLMSQFGNSESNSSLHDTSELTANNSPKAKWRSESLHSSHSS